MALIPITDPSAIDGARLDETELVDAIRSLEELKAKASAAQARLARELDDRVRERHAEQGVRAAQRGRDVPSLIGFARRESPARGRRFLGLARSLAELPHTAAAMEAGALSEWRATLVARETACLAVADRAIVDERICARRSDGSFPFDGWGDRRLVAEAMKQVADVDPAALVERRSRAEADRGVSLRPAPELMARLSALLPAAQGVAVWATLGRAADEARAAGDPRTRQQVMADTLYERVTGLSAAEAVPVTVNLVVSDETLLGHGAAPGWMQDFGPVSAETADDLVRRAVTDAHAAIRRLYATPEAGTLVGMDSVARQFPAGLATFLDLRDRTCRSAYCDAPIRHHDHVVRHADGGATSAVNGQGACEQCNYAKEAPGWSAHPTTGPPGAPHIVETTLPTGHVVRSEAPAAPRPSRHRTPRLELYLTDLILNWAA
jgi:hypothetical protein